MLNVVLVRSASRVDGLKDLTRFVEQTRSGGRFSTSEPHVFLFAENHFHTRPPFKTRHHENKPIIRELVNALKGTNWKLAFAVNEKVGKRVSNTGYFVGPSGYSALPKRLIPQSDGDNISIHTHTVQPQEENELRAHWEKRAEKLSGREFQQTDAGGHTVEFRVCADARVEKPPNPSFLTLVSADGIGKLKGADAERTDLKTQIMLSVYRLNKRIDEGNDLGNLPKTRGAVVVNDSTDGLSLLLGEKKFDLLKQLEEANQALKPKGIRIDWHYF